MSHWDSDPLGTGECSREKAADKTEQESETNAKEIIRRMKMWDRRRSFAKRREEKTQQAITSRDLSGTLFLSSLKKYTASISFRCHPRRRYSPVVFFRKAT